MGDEVRCDRCGSGFPRTSREGLCPACLLKVALSHETEAATTGAEEGAGRHFGPYTTIKILGRGGMGIVYLARQERPLHRTVALRVIKPGMGSFQVISRFESVREALARMDHTNIAKVFDAGTAEDGRPYFAMEYVSGVPIVEYCDAFRLTIRERLELFRQVCLGIHHAHQKGIIHRDIKPSNVLVEMQDGKPVPKVIDFGVAKAIRESMSPEQAQFRPDGVDSATDIYALGVMLYELLVGGLPFEAGELPRAGFLEIPPTGRLRAMGETGAEVATRRRTDVHSLERQLRRDLEWITMRAVAQESTRRYPSASELAEDIGRHLRDEPVAAGPQSLAYRFRKFVRRRRLPVMAAAVVVIALLWGLRC